ncbi:MAG: AGE family epimerase/isomerase [Pseudomonadota bacterium]
MPDFSSVTTRVEERRRDLSSSLLARLSRSRITTWLDQAALPFWLAHGVDRIGGGFHEVLGFDGAPVPAEKRLRTMARQTYCFATAAQRGWGDTAACHDAVTHGLQFLSTHARQPNGMFTKTFTFDGHPRDCTPDAYDTAFVLFAAAAAVQAGHDDAAMLGRDVMRQLEMNFYLGRGRGFRETADGGDGTNTDGLRRANPHMHLLEACTAWHRATGARLAAAWAREIVEIFFAHFFDAETWSVREFVNADLSPCDSEDGAVREPGHAYEWAWLLHDLDMSGSGRTRWAVQRLAASATAFGTNPVTGLTYQQITEHGEVIDATSRSWPQTEAVRAMLALRKASGGGARAIADVDARIDAVFDTHISPAPAGLWFDHIAADGSVLSKTVPASILYHLISAFSAVLDHESTALEGSETGISHGKNTDEPSLWL